MTTREARDRAGDEFTRAFNGAVTLLNSFASGVVSLVQVVLMLGVEGLEKVHRFIEYGWQDESGEQRAVRLLH